MHESHPLKVEGNSIRDLREMDLRHSRLSACRGWRHGKRDGGNPSETFQAERDFYGCKKLSKA